MRGLRNRVDPNGLPSLERRKALEGRNQSVSKLYRRHVGKNKPGWIVSKIFFLGFSCDSGVLSETSSGHIYSRVTVNWEVYLRIQDPQNIFGHLAWSLVGVVLFRYLPLSHLLRSPKMTTFEPHMPVDLAGRTSAYTKNHCEALYTTHICRLQIALKFF